MDYIVADILFILPISIHFVLYSIYLDLKDMKFSITNKCSIVNYIFLFVLMKNCLIWKTERYKTTSEKQKATSASYA